MFCQLKSKFGLQCLLVISLFVTSLPVPAGQKLNGSSPKAPETLAERNKLRFEEINTDLPKNPKLGELFDAYSVFMTSQARSDIGAMMEAHRELPAPKILFKDDVFTIQGQKQKMTLRLVLHKTDSYWQINKRKILIKDLKSPEDLLEKTEQIINKELNRKMALTIPDLFFGESAEAFSLMGGVIAGMIAMGISMAAGFQPSTTAGLTIAAFGLGAGPLSSWFTPAAKTNSTRPSGSAR